MSAMGNNVINLRQEVSKLQQDKAVLQEQVGYLNRNMSSLQKNGKLKIILYSLSLVDPY